MNQLLILAFLIFGSGLAHGQTGFMFDDDETPAKKLVPVVQAPTPAANDDDDDDEVYPPLPVRRPVTQSKPKQVTTEDDSEGRYEPLCSNCSRQPPVQVRIRVQAPTFAPTQIRGTAEAVNSPIWASFARNFSACAPGCQPIGIGVYRDPRVRPNPSCHHTKQAIDVAGMDCGGQRYLAIKESGRGIGRFSDMVRCMRRSMKTIYMADDHYDHAHFSNGCIALMSGTRMY